MTNRLEELARRVEAATGPDRGLDVEIAEAMLSYLPSLGLKVPEFTASLDAAMTFVPEGWRVENLSEWDAECLRKNGAWLAQLVPLGDATHGRAVTCEHGATPALALTAAALRAAQEKRDG